MPTILTVWFIALWMQKVPLQTLLHSLPYLPFFSCRPLIPCKLEGFYLLSLVYAFEEEEVLPFRGSFQVLVLGAGFCLFKHFRMVHSSVSCDYQSFVDCYRLFQSSSCCQKLKLLPLVPLVYVAVQGQLRRVNYTVSPALREAIIFGQP